jgi:hypothetical protein
MMELRWKPEKAERLGVIGEHERKALSDLLQVIK